MEGKLIYRTSPAFGWAISNGGIEPRLFYEGDYGCDSTAVHKDNTCIVCINGIYKELKLKILDKISDDDDGSSSYEVEVLDMKLI